MKLFMLVAAAAILSIVAADQAAPAQSAGRVGKPVIVLVHGAFADGSSWGKVISMLQAEGHTVVAVQNPLTSLSDDVAATNRAINQQTGPVVLVGHSWGGVVITQAGNNPRVSALVYVSASAPDSGQSLVDAAAGSPPAPWQAEAIKDEGGFLTLPAATIARHFAQDLTPAEQGVVAATQSPWFSGCVNDKVTRAAWRDKPSWWVIGENDHMIDAKLQARMAANIKAKVTRAPTSHVVMLADPGAVTAVIVAAADAVRSGKSVGAHDPADGNVVSNPASIAPSAARAPAQTAATLTARDVRGAAAVVPLSGEAPAKLVVDPPLADSLADGRVVIQYRAENMRIFPVFGPAALDVSPRIGHIHVTVNDGPWRWLDTSGEPVIINKLPPGPHKVLIELVNANHQTVDRAVVNFVVPRR